MAQQLHSRKAPLRLVQKRYRAFEINSHSKKKIILTFLPVHINNYICDHSE